MTPIFGYGSLILPTSLISRFENVDPTLDDVYEGNTERNVRANALEKWEERRERIVYVPAKIRGFRRYYSLESDRGGTMLEAVRTDDPDDWINGVLVFGLTAEEKNQIRETETPYDYTGVRDPELEYYVDPDRFDEYDVTDISEVRLFANSAESADITAEKPRNGTYHSRIVNGIMMIGETYGSAVATEFYRDFCASTYETAYDSTDATDFNTVAENDEISGDSAWTVRE
ncbi:hypothetical protein [Halobellus rarus]|uniref:Gamma-glutamylcyclotransferase n=1 Tax=Halobellus rarus TaxID=1126237 RepID=A0ABD6CJD9_9EURY|nr:hypothetical protein [Halobellus rarus]